MSSASLQHLQQPWVCVWVPVLTPIHGKTVVKGHEVSLLFVLYLVIIQHIQGKLNSFFLSNSSLDPLYKFVTPSCTVNILWRLPESFILESSLLFQVSRLIEKNLNFSCGFTHLNVCIYFVLTVGWMTPDTWKEKCLGVVWWCRCITLRFMDMWESLMHHHRT